MDDRTFEQRLRAFIESIEGKRPFAAFDIPDLSAEQRKRLMYVLAAKQPCILREATGCTGPSYVVGTLQIPDPLKKANEQTVFFSLCKLCVATVGHKEQVKREVIARLEQRKETVH